jgi:hypothetical protein
MPFGSLKKNFLSICYAEVSASNIEELIAESLSCFCNKGIKYEYKWCM